MALQQLWQSINLDEARHNDIDSFVFFSVLQDKVFMLKVDQVGMDTDGGENLLLKSVQPGKATQNHVGVRERKASRSTFKVLHFHFNILWGRERERERGGGGVGVKET